MSERQQGPSSTERADLRRLTKERLISELLALRHQLGTEGDRDWRRFRRTLSTVRAPAAVEPVFLKAQDYVARYFREEVHRPDEATITIAGERYVLMRAASMSVEFVELVTSLYHDKGATEARSVADNLLFDFAHSIGKADARSFHQKMGVTDPIERLSAGPIHFAFSGWAFVHILPESNPTPDDDFFLLYDHPFSFESDAWLAKGRRSDKPVCIMNAGYSSGWCEESFGLPLVSAEIECAASGGERCRFIMAPPSRIEEHLARHATGGPGSPAHAPRATAIAVPEFFQRRRLEDELRRANEQLEQRVQARTAALVEANERLQHEIAERQLAEQQLRLLGSAVENASEGIVIIAVGSNQAEPRITFVNQGLCRMTGYQSELLVGQTLAVLGIAEDDLPVLDSLHHSLADGRPFQAEATATRADGSPYALELHVMPAESHGRAIHWIGILRDVSERKTQVAALRRQAVHDALTELPNRILLYDRLEQEILKVGRSKKTLALLFMDLNGFKEVNDTFGHHAGDVLLRQVGPRLRAELRSTDTVARLGGDEFAILLPEILTAERATAMARALLAAISRPFTVDGQQLAIGASIGIALCPEHGSDPGTLMRRADVAMYVAKNGGRGYEVYSPESDAHSPERLTLLGELRHDACRDQFLLHFQPEVDFTTGHVVRCEALVRWQHPHYGLLLPAQFIPLAETGNAIEAVTEWVLGEAVRQCRRWQQAGHRVGVAVNLSPRDLRHAGLPATIASLLASETLEPGWLTLEITEGSLLADAGQATAVLDQIVALGVRLSIDDFGTGYSSLAHLKHLPASEIKIDRSFVHDMLRNEHDAAIVRSMIDLAHNLDRRIVAEGIEEPDTWCRLSELGCDIGQGFLISPPLGPADLLGWMRGPSWAPPAAN